MPLDREEYVEQAYFFQTLRERMQQDMSTQDLLVAIRQEILATTMLPFALDFMAGELRLTGGFATAMARLPHYFTPFQTYVVGEAEKAEGRFDFRIALEILQREVEYRAAGRRRKASSSISSRPSAATAWATTAAWRPSPPIAIFDENWREWILTVRRQVGLIDFGRHDLRPQRALSQDAGEGREADPVRRKGGANRAGQSPQGSALSVFGAAAALGLSERAAAAARGHAAISSARLQQRVDRLETRVEAFEEELRGGINLSRFYAGKEGKRESG